MKKIVLLIIIAGFIAACSGSRPGHKTKNAWPITGDAASASIIVLPFENQTNNLIGHKMLRKMAFDKFSKKGYHTVSMEEVDEKLKKKGITDGGQLPYISRGVLKEVFGNRLACFGTVEDFTFQNLGFIVRKKVGLKIKVVSLLDNKIIFEHTGKGSDTKFFLSKDEAKEAFVEQMAVKLIGNMFKSPLKRESRKAIRKIFKKIPKRYTSLELRVD
ncbi:MAG: DUF799 family lipoprotein [Elusimicrobiota bacterium]|nr:DUF799 family lipoprotein [Elusimicrobiota bacterium]